MLTKGNKKLDRSVGIFSLPAVLTCPNCKDCEASCYAKCEEDRFGVIREHRQRNLSLTKTPEFIRLMVNEIISHKVKIVRIHESGDFYSKDYIEKWEQIAKSLPTVRFYGYSKCWGKFPKALARLNSLDNVNIIDSVTPIGKNYGGDEYIQQLRAMGYSLCPLQIIDPAEGKKCMRDCKLCLTASKVCFKAHGNRRKRA